MADAPMTRGRVELLDLLRALAVLAVLMFHYCFRGAVADQSFTTLSLPALAPYAKYGSLGVQLFFVISGFVIAYSAEQRSAGEFAIARIARIYPGFLVCMTLTFIVTLAFGAPRFQATFGQWLANYAIAAPAVARPFMDGAYWSLVYEMTFYAWIAALIMFGWLRRYVDVVIIVWMAIAVLNHELRSSALQRVFLTDQSGFFAAGLAIYEIYCGRRDVAIKLLLALATVIAIGQSLDLMQWGRVHFQVAYSDWIAAGISVAAIAAVGLAVCVRRVPLPPKLILAIGGVTYPLYLLHQQIGYIVFNRLNGMASPWLIITMTAVAMAALAWAMWRYVERPGQRLFKRLLSRIAAQANEVIAFYRFKQWRSP